ncbi:MAG: hypothetical protein ACRYF4_14725 [Janthinobacterium lividum]
MRPIEFACLCTSLLLSTGLSAQSATPAAAPVPPSQKVLIHIHSDNPADWQAAMDKANATMSSAKPGSTVVEMLITGDGLKLINKDNSSMTGPMGASLDKDVSYVACHASMKANHMEIGQLDAGVGTVPSGGREMAMKKAEGWTMLDDKKLQ